jgi:two-component system, NtrC family, sensor kinase
VFSFPVLPLVGEKAEGYRCDKRLPAPRDDPMKDRFLRAGGYPAGYCAVGSPARGNKYMTQMLDDTVAELRRTVAELEQKLDERTAELAARNSEYGERIEQQSATIDVLKVMSASPGDPQPVFDLIVRRAQELCNGWGVTLCEFDGHLVHLSALCGKWEPSAVAAYRAAHPLVPTRASITCRAILDRQVVHIRDIEAEPELLQVMRNIGWKSNLALPLLRDGVAIGAISLTSELPGGFSDSQVALLQTFAEQAVIAISGAETYRELRQRTGDLQDSLEYQTATSDVLKVISRSTFDLHPVLDTLVETAARLCEADNAIIFRLREGRYHVAASVGFSPEFREHHARNPTLPGRGTVKSRLG